MTRKQLVCATVLLAAALTSSCRSGNKKSAETKPAPAQYKVRLQTTKGDILILVHRDWSPLGADHF